MDQGTPAATGRQHRFHAAKDDVRIVQFAAGDTSDAQRTQSLVFAAAQDSIKPTRGKVLRHFGFFLEWSVDGPAQKITIDPGGVDVTSEPKGKRAFVARAVDAKNGKITYTLTVVPQGGGAPKTETTEVEVIPDLPIAKTLALVYSPKAPLAGGTTDPLDDRRAVWTFAHPNASVDACEAVVYFHGDNGFITVDEDAGATRLPTWLRRKDEGARTKAAVGIDMSFENERQYEPNCKPVLFVPEVGIHKDFDFAQDALIRAYAAAVQRNIQLRREGKPTEPLPRNGYNPWAVTSSGSFATDKAALASMIDDCLGRLVATPSWPSGGFYLRSKPDVNKLKRLILVAHSGGGIQLGDSVGADLTTRVPTLVWSLEASYAAFDNTKLTAFCRANRDRIKSGECRLVMVALGGTNTAAGMDSVWQALQAEKLFTASEMEPRPLQMMTKADEPKFKQLVRDRPLAFVSSTGVIASHGQTPNVYLPWLFQSLSP